MYSLYDLCICTMTQFHGCSLRPLINHLCILFTSIYLNIYICRLPTSAIELCWSSMQTSWFTSEFIEALGQQWRLHPKLSWGGVFCWVHMPRWACDICAQFCTRKAVFQHEQQWQLAIPGVRDWVIVACWIEGKIGQKPGYEVFWWYILLGTPELWYLYSFLQPQHSDCTSLMCTCKTAKLRLSSVFSTSAERGPVVLEYWTLTVEYAAHTKHRFWTLHSEPMQSETMSRWNLQHG